MGIIESILLALSVISKQKNSDALKSGTKKSETNILYLFHIIDKIELRKRYSRRIFG
jgi:hypothetical protein